MTGNAPSMMGESWLAVEITSRFWPRLMSQAQPEPKRVVPAVLKSSLNLSKPPKVLLIAPERLPTGADCFWAGLRISQKREWLWWPPPLLRTAVRIFSGTMERLLARISWRGLPSRLGAPSEMALLRLLT